MDVDLEQDVQKWAKSGLANPPLWRGKPRRARKRIQAQLVQLATIDRQSNDPVSLVGKLLFQMQQNDQMLDTNDIVDRVMTTCFVGADSTTSAVVSMWKVLSKDPQTKLQLRSNPDSIPTFVSNILQTFPPAAFGMRQVKEELQVGDYTIPQDWFVVYGLAGALHAKEEPNDWLRLERNVASWAFGGGKYILYDSVLSSE